QIQKRGRAYESNIRLDYLNKLNERYEKWISEYSPGKLLVVDVDTVHFDETQEDMQTVINRIDELIWTQLSR
ncbi:MAG: deoxynucleoside kinase, partial [Bacteroidales bacterium]|nr:deoxynucleoside kinase [Bacteroidales bacterium]